MKGWKYAFFALLGVIIGLVVFIFIRITTIAEPNLPDVTGIEFSGQPIGKITINKEQANHLINRVLDNFQGENQTFRFYLDDEAILEMTYRILGSEIPLYVYFEPSATEEGNVELNVSRISAGALSLPATTVFHLMKSSIDVPPYVEIDAENTNVTIRFDKMYLSDSMQVRATFIDLVNDTLQFDFYMDTP